MVDEVRVLPLTQERWADFEALFSPNSICRTCWCMYWRLKHSDYGSGAGEGNKQAMRAIVESGEVPGLLAYRGDEPVGWCSIAPRERYPRLGRSRVLKPIDDQQVWAGVCFYVARRHRGQGLMETLLRAALDYARSQGATIVEGYPRDAAATPVADISAYTGVATVFQRVGFVECARRSPVRPIMRCYL